MRMPWLAAVASLLVCSGVAAPVAALQVQIQDTVLKTIGPGDQCILIAGKYRGVMIEPSEQGKRAKICYDTIRQNLMIITDSTFINTEQGPGEIEIRFDHSFPPGPNRKVVAHARIGGFFATATGVGVATGAEIRLDGTFNQGGHADPIGDGVVYTVGTLEKDPDAGLFKDSSRERYLAAGARELTGSLLIKLPAQGDKLVLHIGAQVDVQPVARIQEKFEEAEEGIEDELGF